MNKTLIICCDGTWNAPETEEKQTRPTNVLRLARALKPVGSRGHQVVYYDMGVGTGGWWDKWVGGAMGVGLSDNIQQAYRFLVNNWNAGDRICLFGFSRGAYTVRSLAGLLNVAGLLPKYAMPQFPGLYRYYRTPPEKRQSLDNADDIQALMDQALMEKRRPPVDFLGVWDTVGALGLPIQGLRKLSRNWVGFHDTQLSTSVRYGVQALAVDERRKPFAADLWTHAPDASQERREQDEQRILQVWFAGNHSDIGGGYPDTRLADLSFDFMLTEAEQHGLEFDTRELGLSAPGLRYQGKMHDEYGFPYSLQGSYLRPLGNTQRQPQKLQDSINERLHQSALRRLDENREMLNAENLRAARDAGQAIYSMRSAPRLSLASSVDNRLQLEGHEFCELLDYSRTGVRVRCEDAVAEGEKLTLYHPTVGQRRSEVRWQRGDQVGLQFAA